VGKATFAIPLLARFLSGTIPESKYLISDAPPPEAISSAYYIFDFIGTGINVYLSIKQTA